MMGRCCAVYGCVCGVPAPFLSCLLSLLCISNLIEIDRRSRIRRVRVQAPPL